MNSNARAGHNLDLGILTTISVWSEWKPGRLLYLMKRFWIVKQAAKRRQRILKEEGIMIPPLIIHSVTMSCNLACLGCYSRGYTTEGELDYDQMDRLFGEATELGVAFFVLTGGEPLMVPRLLDLLEKHRKIIYLLFTNSSFLDDETAERIARMGHVVPMLSLEGDAVETDRRRGAGVYDSVMKSMAALAKHKAFFGFSSVVSQRTVETLSKDSYYNDLYAKGCRIGLLVNYVPLDEKKENGMLLQPDTQITFRKKVVEFQKTKRMLLMHMPDDEYDVGGSCYAAGRGFVHINAQGDVEPCPFAQMAAHSVKKMSLKEALDGPFFKHIRSNPKLTKRPEVGCSIFENRKELMKSSEKLGIYSTLTKKPVTSDHPE